MTNLCLDVDIWDNVEKDAEGITNDQKEKCS